MDKTTSSEEQILQRKGYNILTVLGEGTYAKVYLAEFNGHSYKDIRTKLACKVIDVKKSPVSILTKFLPRELNILTKLNHPYVIHVHSILYRNNKFFIFMRFAEQGDLLTYITNHGALSEAHSRLWFRQMILAVQYLHEMDICHRDLKCENALISQNFNIKIADFGFAKVVVDKFNKPELSSTYCGSLSYSAPEVIHGTPYSPKEADIWSLGAILFVMINKMMPFDSNHPKKLYELQLKRAWRYRMKVTKILSDELLYLFSKLLEPEIIRRYTLNQVLTSDWIAVEPDLTQLSIVERTAKENAQKVTKRASRLDIAKVMRDAQKEMRVLVKESTKPLLAQSDALQTNLS